MEQSPSSDVNSLYFIEPNVCHRVRNNPQAVLILSQINPRQVPSHFIS